MRRLALAVAFAATATACGGSSGTTSPDPRRFSALSQQVATTAASYGAQASGMASAAACSADESTYDGQVRPMVTELQGMGPAMDDRMGSMTRGSDADMDCAANAMLAELDRHRAAACGSPTDMGPNRAEAQQHVAAMTQWADHEMARSAEMGDMMGSGMGGMGGAGATTGHCVRDADGTYRMQP
jgi:hypothetical protein